MRFPSCALAATLLLGSSAAIAQNSAPLRWAEGAPNATSEVKNDTKIEGLKTDDVHIFVSMADVKETEYNRIWVQLSNHGKAPLDFDPQTAVLLNGDKAIKAEAPDKAAKSIQKVGEAKSQELSSAHCAEKSSGGKAGGMGPCQPTEMEVQMSKQVAAFSSQQAQWVRDNSLKQGPIAPNAEEQGAIVFKKDKRAADYILRISVGSQVLEFPLRAQNKPPSYD
jgi:hypothetical protein